MGDTKFRSTNRRTARGEFRTDKVTRKRAEGDVRNEAWRALSTEAQIAVITSRRGESKRQMKRLAAA